jgi:hypothetical protein
VRTHIPLRLLACALALTIGGCTRSMTPPSNPGLAARGSTLTTAKTAHQDLTNKLSLTGKVAMNPVYGMAAPIGGQVRYLDVQPPQATPTKATKVAGIWVNNKATNVEVPAGSMFAGRLVEDRVTVTAGMPIVSARYAGYAIVADIDGSQAYQVSAGLASVQAQIKNGPGPFPCAVLGTIAALPAGTIPDPPAAPAGANPSANAQPGNRGPVGDQPPGRSTGGATSASDPSGMRLVCTAPADVRLINGANATLELTTEKATNALVLPVEAVAGSQGKGKVDVVRPDGTRETKDVVLGLTDGKVVEIKSGLTGDETVAIPGPNLPPAKSDPNGGPSGPEGK